MTLLYLACRLSTMTTPTGSDKISTSGLIRKKSSVTAPKPATINSGNDKMTVIETKNKSLVLLTDLICSIVKKVRFIAHINLHFY